MSAGKSVLLVDDDEALRQTLSDQLGLHEEFSVSVSTTGAEALELVKAGVYDLILLDVGLPDLDGREICKLMRKAGVKTPIIMLTGADSDSDTILGLESGANDYVTKPFATRELVAKVREILDMESK